MIKTNKNHKKVDLTLLNVIKKRIIPAFLGGLIIGTVVDFGPITNINSLKTSYTIQNTSQEAEFEYLDNLDFLLDYPNLRTLTIKDSTIEDISIISKLKNLKTLTIKSSNIGEQTIKSDSIENLVITQSTAELNLDLPNLKNIKADATDSYIQINYISSKKIENANFTEATIFNYDFLNTDNLKTLTLKSMRVFNLDTTKIGKNITELEIKDTNITSLNIEELPKLKKIYIIDNDFVDYNFLKKAKNIEEIYFWFTNFDDTSVLKDHNKLNTLILAGSKIKNIDNLPENIKWLNLSHLDSIENIDNLKNLKHLNTIELTGTEYIVDKEMYDYLNKKHIHHSITKEELEVKERYKKVVSYIINDNMSDFEKVNAIINFCVNQITYDMTLLGDPDILTNAMKGRGVCQAYSDMAVLLGRLAGLDIENIYSPEHVWNVCKIYDNYYTFDATWISKYDLMNSDGKKLTHGLTPIAELKDHNNNDYYSKPFIEPFKITIDSDYQMIIKKWVGNNAINKSLVDNNKIYDNISSEEFNKIINNIFNTNIEIQEPITLNIALSTINDCVGEQSLFLTNSQEEITYGRLIEILEAYLGNYYNESGRYYLNGGNALINCDNIILEGVCDTLYINENNKNINIDKLVYKDIKYLNNNKTNTI